MNSASTNHESGDRTLAANNLAAAVVKMLSASYTHREINDFVRKTVLDETAKLPSRRVLYNNCYGGFTFSHHFTEYLAKNPATSHKHIVRSRDNPLIIQAIADFGREICTRFPFILEDLNAAEKWKLNNLMDSDDAAESGSERALDPDLAARLDSFQASSSRLRAQSFPARQASDNFIDYAETNPETWMLYELSLPAASDGYSHLPIAVQFAHQLLHDAPEIYRDKEPSTGDIDAPVYECVGLAGASGRFSVLCLDTIPAMVDYTIHEYDGKESVEF